VCECERQMGRVDTGFGGRVTTAAYPEDDHVLGIPVIELPGGSIPVVSQVEGLNRQESASNGGIYPVLIGIALFVYLVGRKM